MDDQILNFLIRWCINSFLMFPSPLAGKCVPEGEKRGGCSYVRMVPIVSWQWSSFVDIIYFFLRRDSTVSKELMTIDLLNILRMTRIIVCLYDLTTNKQDRVQGGPDLIQSKFWNGDLVQTRMRWSNEVFTNPYFKCLTVIFDDLKLWKNKTTKTENLVYLCLFYICIYFILAK